MMKAIVSEGAMLLVRKLRFVRGVECQVFTYFCYRFALCMFWAVDKFKNLDILTEWLFEILCCINFKQFDRNMV